MKETPTALRKAVRNRSLQLDCVLANIAVVAAFAKHDKAQSLADKICPDRNICGFWRCSTKGFKAHETGELYGLKLRLGTAQQPKHGSPTLAYTLFSCSHGVDGQLLRSSSSLNHKKKHGRPH